MTLLVVRREATQGVSVRRLISSMPQELTLYAQATVENLSQSSIDQHIGHHNTQLKHQR
jgi:hypothetical protein